MSGLENLRAAACSGELESCRRQLAKALAEAMAQRDCFAGLGWIEHERQALVDAANLWALSHPLCRTVTAEEVERVETMACGHCDYAAKFVLYVSEMLYTAERRPA